MTDYSCITDTILAAHFTPVDRGAPTVVVVHTTESPYNSGLAVSNWFAGKQAPQASAHVVVDNKHVIRCVPDANIAWAAPGANKQGLSVEVCGYAKWGPNDWNDDTLGNAAAIVSAWLAAWGIPAVRLGAQELLAGQSGICGHVDVSKAWKKSTHTDPGAGWPWDRFMQML